jgi:hypothetical protein
MRPSETLIEFFNRFEDSLRNHVLLHGRHKVTTGLGTKFIYSSRAFVVDNCCVEDKNKECMRLYGKAILTDSLKESYLKNAVCDIPEYKFAIMTDSHAGYKELRELLVKTDLNAGRNQKLKSSTTKNQSQYKPSIQYREKQEILVPYTRSESGSARHLWSNFERIPAFAIRIRRLKGHIRHSNVIISIWTGSHLDLTSTVNSRQWLQRQWLQLHPNAYKDPLVSSASNRRQRSSKPNKSNKKRQFLDDRPSAYLSKYGPAPDPKKRLLQYTQISGQARKRLVKPSHQRLS